MVDGSRWRVRRVFGSVRLRITLAATLVFAVAFAVASIALVRSVRASLEDDVRDEVTLAARRVAAEVEAGDVPAPGGMPASVDVDPGAGVVYQVITPNGGVIVGSPGAGEVPFVLPLDDAPEESEQTTGGRILVTQSAESPEGPVTVAAASPLDDVRRTVDTLSGTLVVGIPALVVLVALLVWFLVGRALRPVDAIRAEVEEISHTTMHRRVPVPASHDEVARLADTMNDMLDRLNQASTRQRQFASDASHELRSPLATVHATLELGLRDPNHTDWPAVARQVVSEDQRMAAIIDDLLELSRLDENGSALPNTVVDLDDVVVEEVVRLGDARVDAQAVSAGRVHGQREQLGRAVRNLLANATRHAGENITVALRADGDGVVLTVDDDGPGVPPADRDQVFERFTRLDDGRARDDGGSGLGLAIVRAAATRHGGSVVVTDSELGGARLELRLPSAP